MNEYPLLGLVSIKDIFEAILNKELKDGDIHRSCPVNIIKS